MGEALLSLMQRVGASEENILVSQSNLASLYSELGRSEDSIRIERDVYLGHLKLHGEQHGVTCLVAENYAITLANLRRFEEAKSVLRKMMPVARRVLGESHELTLKMRSLYADALCQDPAATLDGLREAVTTLEDAGRIARRVFGGAHPLAMQMEHDLKKARAKLRAHEIAEERVGGDRFA